MRHCISLFFPTDETTFTCLKAQQVLGWSMILGSIGMIAISMVFLFTGERSKEVDLKTGLSLVGCMLGLVMTMLGCVYRGFIIDKLKYSRGSIADEESVIVEEEGLWPDYGSIQPNP